MDCDEKGCAVCGESTNHRCGRCRVVRYCSKEHQKKHWKMHKSSCVPCSGSSPTYTPVVPIFTSNFGDPNLVDPDSEYMMGGYTRIMQNDLLGRYLVASRDIPQGEIVFADQPLVLGPKQVTEPVCLGCLLPVNGFYTCTLCGWPMCGVECQENPAHRPECQLSQMRGNKVNVSSFQAANPMYECITPLRCLWLKHNDPEKWNLVDQMESHHEDRKQTEVFQLNQTNVVDFVLHYLRISLFTEEEIHTVCGILEVNGFEIPGQGAVALYPYGCLMEHDCIPNTSRVINSKLQLVVRAAVPIKEGEDVKTSYTDPMWGAANRRLHLSSSKYFCCKCDRCLDPTEFGTHINSLKCDSCRAGVLPPPPNPADDWVCTDCTNRRTATDVDRMMINLGERLITLQGSIPASERFLKDTCGVLSENHFYRSDVKLALSQSYGRGTQQMATLSERQLERKHQLCTEVLELANIFSPGLSRLRGVLLYELQAVLAEKHQRLSLKNDMSQAKLFLKEAIGYLEEALNILRCESFIQEFYSFAAQADLELQDLQLKLSNCQDS